MSDPFELPKRVPIACANCRARKIKCITESQYEACMRCHHNGFVCEYVPTDKQSRSAQKASGGSKKTSLTSFTGPDLGQSVSYQAYGGNSPSFDMPQYSSSLSPSPTTPQYPPTDFGHHSYPTSPNLQQHGQPHNRPPSTPAYTQPATYTGMAPASQQFPSPQYQANYPYSVQDWNALCQTKRCICPPGPCYCGGYR
ncbi:hypothetical protein C8R43DRAFT_1107462 [Mycena crocata]|nr:hypothetical protein C8R43DRAFT_1107462 [Mycena crocata]